MERFVKNPDGSPNCVENWNILNQLLERMMWKDVRKMTMVIPPITIASEMRSVTESPVVGECVSPVSGRVRKVVLRAEFVKQSPAIIKLEVEGVTSATSNLIEMTGTVLVHPLDVEIAEGALIRVSCINCTSLSRLGFSCLIDMSSSYVKQLPTEFPPMEGGV